ncbi:hypothetical protein GCM10029964_074140 [Kibdelosporangium lantanae]
MTDEHLVVADQLDHLLGDQQRERRLGPGERLLRLGDELDGLVQVHAYLADPVPGAGTHDDVRAEPGP